MAKAFAVFVLCFAAACGVRESDTKAPESPPVEVVEVEPAPLRVCLAVPEAVELEAVDAVAAWHMVLAPWRELVVSFGPCDATIVETSVEDFPCDESFAACAGTLGGLDQPEPFGEIWLKRGSYEQAVKFIVMHELGHLLGLDHEDGGLMTAYPTKSMARADWECPDPRTVERLSEHLNAADMAACELPAM